MKKALTLLLFLGFECTETVCVFFFRFETLSFGVSDAFEQQWLMYFIFISISIRLHKTRTENIKLPQSFTAKTTIAYDGALYRQNRMRSRNA